MASQLAASSAGALPAPTAYERTIHLLVRRRVAISALLFVALVFIDMFVVHSRPRDVLHVTELWVAAGIVAILAGLATRSWAAGTLRKQRELATTGPYAHVRHPLYFGSFLMMVGFGILIHDPYTLWVVAGPIVWLYWHAIRSEEQKMAKLFPTQWPAYKLAVPSLIPTSLRWPHAADWSFSQWLKNSEHRAWVGSALAIVGLKLWQMWA